MSEMRVKTGIIKKWQNFVSRMLRILNKIFQPISCS